MADRYTVLRKSYDEVPKAIKQADSLGLKWFIRSDYTAHINVLLYLFFDEDGVQKYLSKEWGNTLDTVHGWLKEVVSGEIDSDVFVERCIELFSDSDSDKPNWADTR